MPAKSSRLLPGRLRFLAPARLCAAALASVLLTTLLAPAPAGALALRVPAQTPLVTDVPVEVSATDPPGVGLLFQDGTLVRSMMLAPSAPATFSAVTLAPGTHRLRLVLRSRRGLVSSPVAVVSAWGTPPAPRSMTPVHAGLYPKCVTLPVFVGVGAERLTTLVNGKAVWTSALVPPVALPVALTLPSGVDEIELRAENPLETSSTRYRMTRPTWPVPGNCTVGSGFGMRWGRMHKGIDIHAPYGASVVAAAPGKVIWARYLTSYGALVMIDHGGGMTTYYAHLSRIDVKMGQQVKMGQHVGDVGSAGGAAHLHFQLFVNADNGNPDMYRRVNSGTPVDPYPYVRP